MKTILLYGHTLAAYRPGCFADFFLRRPQEYSVVVVTGGGFFSAWRPLRVVMRCVLLLQCVVGADIVLIQPMNHAGPYARWVMRWSKLLRRKLVVDFYISYYETQVVDRKMHSEGSLVAKKLAKRDLDAITAADLIFFLNESERSYYLSTLGGRVLSLSSILPLVVPCRRTAKTPWLRGYAAVPTIAWWGREGNPLHGFECIAGAIRMLLREGFNARFAVFPAGEKGWESFFATYRDIFDHPLVFVSKEYSFLNGKLEEYLLHEVDLALGTFGLTSKAKTVVANKVIDAASYGLPSVTQRAAGLMEFFKEGESIVISEPDPRALADTIVRSLNDRIWLLGVAENAKSIVDANFSGRAFDASVKSGIERIAPPNGRLSV